MSLNVGELHLFDIPSWSCALLLPKSRGSFGAPRTIVGIGWGLYGFHAGLRVWLTGAGPRSRGTKILLLSPDQAQYIQFATPAAFGG